MYPKHILMTSPKGFRVEYAINPHMLDANGKLNQIDSTRAQQQWSAIAKLYESLGFQVHTIGGDEKFPDMVFCANQTFPFIDAKLKPSVILSRMRAEQRQGEVAHYEKWAKENAIEVYKIDSGSFEGCGDAIWNYETKTLFGGYGFRTEKSVYTQIEKIIGQKIIPLELISEDFYHLDTCFVVLNGTTAAYVEEAFSREALQEIEAQFKDLIRIDTAEAKNNFAGNAFSPDGKNVILQKGASRFISELRKRNFIIHEVETSEFMKSGGSVFCMKQVFFKN